MSNFALSQRSKDRRRGARQELINISDRAIEISIIDFGHPEFAGKRTTEEQQMLYNRGDSKADGIKNLSLHQSGNAIDFYAFVDGKATWDPEYLAIVACAFLQAAMELGYKIQWGGLWTGFHDMPHIQYIGEL